MAENKKETIGVFDSGLGGLTVLKKIVANKPNVNIVYFGDTKYAPYGSRTQAELGALTAQAFYFLKKHGAKKIVTACNSVSTLFMGDFLEALGVDPADVTEMSLPVALSLAQSGHKNVLVLATEATVKSHMHRDAMRSVGVRAYELALPGLVDLIENGANETELYEHIVGNIGTINTDAYDAVVLGCTHFPLVMNVFKSVFDSNITFIDPADSVADAFAHSITCGKLGTIAFYTSSKSKVFNKKVTEMFGDTYTVNVV